MERASLLRWLLIAAAAFVFFQFGMPMLGMGNGGSKADVQPWGNLVDDTAPSERATATSCEIKGPRFRAQLSTRGGALKHLWMTDAKYTAEVGGAGDPIDLVTTTAEARMPLRTGFRRACLVAAEGCKVLDGADQVAYDDFDWKISEQGESFCTFVYSDGQVALTKTIRATERPFELSVEVVVTNKTEETKKHRFSVEQSDYRTNEQTKGSWGRLSEFATKSEIYAGGEAQRWDASDFEPDEFGEADFSDEKWRRSPGNASWAAVSTTYFTKAVFHVEGPAAPFGEAQIEQHWDSRSFPSMDKDTGAGHVFRSRLSYPVQELAAGATTNYKVLGFFGPKERGVLSAMGEEASDAGQLLDLGFFGAIGKILVRYLYFLFGLTKTWGWAICLMTITVKLLLFPLSISQIKSSTAMRKLKPQMDEINAKYKNDAAQKAMATQELWRTNNVTNPMLGCLPVMLQMPVWFALYTSLQTAVELYHTPFGPFIPDLSAPGLYYIIPAALGASSFLQQHLMPMQGDATQQKMMKYMMPGMFTVFMLFLPAGLGIYFLTNTWLGIIQQVSVERYYKSQGPVDGSDAKKDASDRKSAKAETV